MLLLSATKDFFLRLIKRFEIIKDIESLLLTALQLTLNHKCTQLLIFITKMFTRRKIFFIYFIILYFHNYTLFLHSIIHFYLSRYILSYIKQTVQQKRPYIEYSNTITHFKKRKESFSFPSQSMQSLIFIYCSFDKIYPDNFYLHLYFITLSILLAFTRMYRGLHYPHDFIFSIFYSKIFFKLCIYTMSTKISVNFDTCELFS